LLSLQLRLVVERFVVRLVPPIRVAFFQRHADAPCTTRSAVAVERDHLTTLPAFFRFFLFWHSSLLSSWDSGGCALYHDSLSRKRRIAASGMRIVFGVGRTTPSRPSAIRRRTRCSVISTRPAA